MPARQKKKLSPDELELGMLLTDPYLFTLFFWKDDLTIPEHRLDLPKHWRGNQVITLEQRLLFLDGTIYFLFRDTMPEEAVKSSKKVLARTARKIAKTIAYESKYIQAAITNTRPGVTEGLFHAPGEAHIGPVLTRVDSKVDKTPLFDLLHTSRNQSRGIDEFTVGDARWIWHRRIEGQSGTGRNMVGLRAYNDFGDEGDYGQEEPYNERQQTELPECFTWWGGVPRGIRGQFWRIARTGLGKDWSRHVQGAHDHLHYDMRASPLYHSNEAWRDVIGNDTYDSQRVQTQVLGLDGEEARSTFPIIAVNHKLPLMTMKLRSSDMPDLLSMTRVLSRIPFGKVEKASRWIIHSDYGFSPSPMVVGVSYEMSSNVWAQLARFTLQRMDNVQAAMFLHAVDKVLPVPAVLICIDAHGRGAGVLDTLHKQPEYAEYNYSERVIPAGFETQTPDPRVSLHKKCRQPVREVVPGQWWVCDTCHIQFGNEDDLRPAMIPSKQLLTSDLAECLAAGQKFLDTGMLTYSEAVILAGDSELIDEMQGTTSIDTASGYVRFIPPHKDEDHSTDTWRCLMRALRVLRDMEMGDGIASYDEFGWVGPRLRYRTLDMGVIL